MMGWRENFYAININVSMHGGLVPIVSCDINSKFYKQDINKVWGKDLSMC